MSGTGRLNKDIYAKQSSKSGIAFHQGDVLYGKLRPYLQNWLLPTFDGLAVGDFWVLQPQNADSSFLYRLIQSRQFDEVANQSTGTKMPRADWKLVSKTVFSIPSNISEQAAIGTYFTALDSLITLHQRNSIGYIFKVRAYTNAWEQRKFEDLYDYASEGGTPDTNNPAFYEGGKIPFVKIEDTVEKYIDSPKSYITEEGMNHSSAWLIPKGNVIFTNGATVGNVAINRLPVTTKQGILGIIPSKKVTSEFLFYLLSSTEFQREVRSRMATGTFATIILKSLNEIPVCFPSNTNEQESIITILSKLDNLITLHQRERKNRLFGGKNVKQYNFSRSVLQLLRAMDTRLQRRGCSQGDYG